MDDFISLQQKLLAEYRFLGSWRIVAGQYSYRRKPVNVSYVYQAAVNGKRPPAHIFKVLMRGQRLGKSLFDESPADLLARLNGRSEMPPIIPELRAVLETL
jgi:hypothetical protein